MVRFDGKTPEKVWKAGAGPEALLAAFIEDDPNFGLRSQFGMAGAVWVASGAEPKRGLWLRLKLTLARLLVDKRIGQSVTIGQRRFVYSLDSVNI